MIHVARAWVEDGVLKASRDVEPFTLDAALKRKAPAAVRRQGSRMVGATGIEPVTPAV